MPLEQRVIEPVYVSRSTLPLPPNDTRPLIKPAAVATGQGAAATAAVAANIKIANELECVTNGSLANLIRQLSTLSRQAEELLGSVFNEASSIMSRTVSLQQRMDGLMVKVTNLDQPKDAPITLRDATDQREIFSSNMSYDQQVLTRQTVPTSITELYQMCDKPPPFEKLDQLREDGKSGLKFYTDPNYFFELWKKEMLKETMLAQQQQQQIQQQQLQQLRQQQQNIQKHQQRQQQKRTQQQGQTPQSIQQSQQMQQQQAIYYSTKPRHMVVSTNGSYPSPSMQSIDSNENIYNHNHIVNNNNNNSVTNNMQHNSMDTAKSTEVMTRYLQQVNLNDTPSSNSNQNAIVQQHQQLQMNAITQPQNTVHQQQQNINSVPNQQHQSMSSNYYSQSSASNNGNSIHSTQISSQPPPPPTQPPPPPAPPFPETELQRMSVLQQSNDNNWSQNKLQGYDNRADQHQTTNQQKFTNDATSLKNPNVTPGSHLHVKNSPGTNSNQQAPSLPPPPPPLMQPPTALQLQLKQQQLRKTQPVQSVHSDPRSDLLAAIKKGITLRKVEDSKQKEAENKTMANDVASILARRVAMQVSDSDDGGEDDEEDNDWDDESEC